MRDYGITRHEQLVIHVSPSPVALAALKNKKRLENDLIQIAGKKEVLERQLSAIEDANLNKEVFKTMQRSGEVLKTIHGSLCVITNIYAFHSCRN